MPLAGGRSRLLHKPPPIQYRNFFLQAVYTHVSRNGFKQNCMTFGSGSVVRAAAAPPLPRLREGGSLAKKNSKAAAVYLRYLTELAKIMCALFMPNQTRVFSLWVPKGFALRGLLVGFPPKARPQDVRPGRGSFDKHCNTG